MTAVAGTTLLIDSSVHVALALTMPTPTFLAVHREISWVILGGGLAILLFTRGRPRTGNQEA